MVGFFVFGFAALLISLLPSILLLILARVASNKNKSYKPFSPEERNQTIFELSAIAILGPLIIFFIFMLCAQVPILFFVVIPLMLTAYALPMMIFWDFDLFDAALWSFVVLGTQLGIGSVA